MRKQTSPNYCRTSVNLIVEPGLYMILSVSGSCCVKKLRYRKPSFFFQAEDGIRDDLVTGFRRVLFRSEYSGFKFAIFFMAEYFGMFAAGGMAATLFLGGYAAPVQWLDWIPSWVWFFTKMMAFIFLLIDRKSVV